MRRFTIITILLTVIVVVASSEVFKDVYIPSFATEEESTDEYTLPDSLETSSAQTNVLGADIDYSNIPAEDLNDLNVEIVDINSEISDFPDTSIEPGEPSFASGFDETFLDSPPVPSTASQSPYPDFEDEEFSPFATNIYIRDDMVQSAGFNNAYIENEPHEGYLFKSIYIDDLYDTEIYKSVVRNKDKPLAKVYVFQVGPLSGVDQIFEILKVRSSEGMYLDINQTNEFGDGSFYMNDTRRQNVAFLTVRIGGIIYSFSYPKEYHQQIKNLITLIDMEF